MRILKATLLFLFLGMFVHARAHSYTLTLQKKAVAEKKMQDLKLLKFFTDIPDHNNTFKRKLKPRGLQVGILVIFVLAADLNYIYTDFTPDLITNSHASFLYCVPSKRGPPLI